MRLLIPMAVMAMGMRAGPSSDQKIDIVPQLQVPQLGAEGEHPFAWAEDVEIDRYNGRLAAVEISIDQWATFHYAYDPLDTSNIEGGEHRVAWMDIWNSMRVRSSTILLCEDRRTFMSARHWAPKGFGDVDFGDPPVVGSRELEERSEPSSFYLTDPALLSLFEGEGQMTLRIVSWSDYALFSAAKTWAAHSSMLSGGRIEVTYHSR